MSSAPLDPLEPLARLFRDLRTGRQRLAEREAQRRLVTACPRVPFPGRRPPEPCARRRPAGDSRAGGRDADGIAPDTGHPEERLLTADGRSVAVRPTRADDRERITALIDGLSPGSRAMRFGAVRAGLARRRPPPSPPLPGRAAWP